MESNLLLEQYSWYKKQQLAKAPFECLLNADIEPNPHQVNAFCAAIQALKTGGIILADEVGLGKTIEAGLVLNYVLDNGAKKVLISLPATLRKQWEVELLPFLSFSFFLIINKKERSRGVETSILSTCNNYKPRWKSNGVFFNRFFGGFVLRATLKSNFVASAMSCSIIEISLLRL